MAKWFRSSWEISIGDVIGWMIFTIGGGLIGLFSAILSKTASTSDVAAWVQAIGSIIAVWAAIGIAYSQNKNALELAKKNQIDEVFRKYSAIKAVADIAKNELQICTDAIEKPDIWEDYFTNYYSSELLQEAEAMLSAIPLHETGSADLVHGIRNLIGAVRVVHRIAERIYGDVIEHKAIDFKETIDLAQRYSHRADHAVSLIHGTVNSVKH